ncbi:hypothetical protein [uncultured Chryseobacterium sp.]|uniref:hypothetical protein n=1 Tax=uncultured Chryseobacterium sp. TaxID=259322 RepID=UPI0025FAA873|nr:hypothetical protein [uncultured Chryseobacterium sp.]
MKIIPLKEGNFSVSKTKDFTLLTEEKVAGGHTPFMQVFRIREDHETVFYSADDLPQESYLKYYLSYKSDYDSRRAMDLRTRWIKENAENHWKILLYHDLENGSGILKAV